MGRVKTAALRVLVRAGVGIAHAMPTELWIRIREESGMIGRLDYRLPIDISVDSWIESEVRLQSCAKEPETVEWIESWFRPGDVFYDIGANVGAYSLVAFRFLAGDVKIYAFEPGFVTYPQLSRNVYLNEGNESIIPLPVALFDKTALVAFHYQNLTTGGALHALGDPIDQRGRQFHPVFTIPTLSYKLDDFVQQFGLHLPNHLKIDVDGIEFSILKGAEQTISHSGLRSILIEAKKGFGNYSEIALLLERAGFVLHGGSDENSLFIRRGLQP